MSRPIHKPRHTMDMRSGVERAAEICAGNFYSAAFAAAHQASVGGAEQMMDIVHTTTPAKYQCSSNPQALKGGIKAQAAQEKPR